MKSYRDVIEHISDKHEKFEEMVEFKVVLDEMMGKLERYYPELYKEFLHKFEEVAFEIPLDKAHKIVKGMRPFGEHWSYETVKKFIEDKGIYNKCISYYLVMNMVYNDYYDVATNFGHQSDVEFYYELANAFINDEDGKKFKVERYFGD